MSFVAVRLNLLLKDETYEERLRKRKSLLCFILTWPASKPQWIKHNCYFLLGKKNEPSDFLSRFFYPLEIYTTDIVLHYNLHYNSNASRILVFWSHSGNLCLRTQNSLIIYILKLPFISEKKFKTCYKAFYSLAWEFLQIYLCQSLGIG